MNLLSNKGVAAAKFFLSVNWVAVKCNYVTGASKRKRLNTGYNVDYLATSMLSSLHNAKIPSMDEQCWGLLF